MERRLVVVVVIAAALAGCSLGPLADLSDEEKVAACIASLENELNKTSGRNIASLFSASMVDRATWVDDAAFRYTRLGSWNGPFTVTERPGHFSMNEAGVMFTQVDVFARTANEDNATCTQVNLVIEDGRARILALQNGSAVYCGRLVFW